MPFIPMNPEGREKPEPGRDDREMQDLTLRNEQDEVARWKKAAEAAKAELAALKEEHLRRLAELESQHENALARERQKMDLTSRRGEAQLSKTREAEEALKRERDSTVDRVRELEEALKREQNRGELWRKSVEEEGRRRTLAHETGLAQEREKLRELSRKLEESEKKARALEKDQEKLREASRKLEEAEKRARALEKELASKPAYAAPPPVGPAAPAAGNSGPAGPAPARPEAVPGRLQGIIDGIVRSRPAWSAWPAKDKDSSETTRVVQLVQAVLEEAVRRHASDIHVEALEDAVRVRVRVDGIMEEVLRYPHSLNLPMVARVRVMCGLDPEQGSSTARPQEGRMVAHVDGQPVDVRLSTLPTAHGDKAVLRLIYRSPETPDLTKLGIPSETISSILELIHRPQGMIVMTGPAGSGKSTTLYSLLQLLNSAERNIVTLEDPMEMKIAGINQSSIQSKIGFTFAEGLRSILRQDPNVIMVGEIRDKETAEIAMSASLTGHLLLTSLHTNSAAGAITRLLDMGLEPYLVASAVTASLAQRLARRTCEKCREARAPGKEELDLLKKLAQSAGARLDLSGPLKLFRGKGCEACRGTGYKGRVLLFEMVKVSSAVRKLVLEKASLNDIQAAAVKEGLAPMLGQGLRRVLSGETTLEEIARLVAPAD